MARTITAVTARRLDKIADLMADGCPSVTEAARRMRITQTEADRLWQRVRRQLGAQAR